MSQWQITFSNFSSVDLTLNYYWHDKLVSQNAAQIPGPTLEASDGVQVMGMDLGAFGSLANNDVDFGCTWLNPKTGWRFGVWIHQPVQVFGMGTGPYFRVACDNITDPTQRPAEWTKPHSDPAAQYAWPTENLGLKVTAMPTAGHDSLSVGVSIEDPS